MVIKYYYRELQCVENCVTNRKTVILLLFPKYDIFVVVICNMLIAIDITSITLRMSIFASLECFLDAMRGDAQNYFSFLALDNGYG